MAVNVVGVSVLSKEVSVRGVSCVLIPPSMTSALTLPFPFLRMCPFISVLMECRVMLI